MYRGQSYHSFEPAKLWNTRIQKRAPKTLIIIKLSINQKICKEYHILLLEQESIDWENLYNLTINILQNASVQLYVSFSRQNLFASTLSTKLNVYSM